MFSIPFKRERDANGVTLPQNTLPVVFITTLIDGEVKLLPPATRGVKERKVQWEKDDHSEHMETALL